MKASVIEGIGKQTLWFDVVKSGPYPLDRNRFPAHTDRPRNHLATHPKMVVRGPPFYQAFFSSK